MREVSTGHEISRAGGEKILVTNKLIKIFCKKYTLVQFFDHNAKSIIA